MNKFNHADGKSEMIGRQAGVVCEDFITQCQLLDLSPDR